MQDKAYGGSEARTNFDRDGTMSKASVSRRSSEDNFRFFDTTDGGDNLSLDSNSVDNHSSLWLIFLLASPAFLLALLLQ